jgi:hypothetical protein
MQLSDSNDRIKSTWNIVKTLTGRNSHIDILPTSGISNFSNTSDITYADLKNIAESFNEYLLSLENFIITNLSSNSNNCNPTDNIVQTGSGVHPTSYTMGTGGSF